SRPRQNLQETTHNLPGSCKCINNFPLQTLAAKGSPDCSGSTIELEEFRKNRRFQLITPTSE
ncbi:hypothetical protein, partial [Paraburkholderia sp. BR10954]|uniref:hypothetical protein n=1 Tax=Paraburkholderia sp. BR10954 TaxID=3236995 RepID=UPI0034D26873